MGGSRVSLLTETEMQDAISKRTGAKFGCLACGQLASDQQVKDEGLRMGDQMMRLEGSQGS
jgi:hypothetical protein